MGSPRNANPPKSDYWPCACVKRDRKTKRMTHIRLNHPDVKKCRTCGSKKPKWNEGQL